jgi:hypothetical protein
MDEKTAITIMESLKKPGSTDPIKIRPTTERKRRTTMSRTLSHAIDGRTEETEIFFFAFINNALKGSATLPGVKLLTATPNKCTGATSLKEKFVSTFHFIMRRTIFTLEIRIAIKINSSFELKTTEANFTGSENHIRAIRIEKLRRRNIYL